MATPVTVGIFGSCVSRDTFEVLDPKKYALAMYVARHSVVSTGTDARSHLPDQLNAPHAFQLKQLEMDARGALWNRIDSVVERLDLLLWDLVDERHGYVRFPDGTYITRSIDLLSQPSLSASLDAGRSVPFGTDEHFQVWCLAADRFVDGLRHRDLLGRTLVLAVEWASLTTDNEPAPLSMGVHAADANARYVRYYDHLAAMGLSLVSVQDPRTDPKHRWGAAPFHYEEAVYREVQGGIESFLKTRTTGQAAPG